MPSSAPCTLGQSSFGRAFLFMYQDSMVQHAYNVIDTVDKKRVIKQNNIFLHLTHACILLLTTPSNNWNRYFHPHVIDGYTRAQRVQVTCPRPQSGIQILSGFKTCALFMTFLSPLPRTHTGWRTRLCLFFPYVLISTKNDCIRLHSPLKMDGLRQGHFCPGGLRF